MTDSLKVVGQGLLFLTMCGIALAAAVSSVLGSIWVLVEVGMWLMGASR